MTSPVETIPPKRITIKDIAREVGLSPTTVSLVLGGETKSKSIPSSTCMRVLDAAKRLDYQPDYTARALVQQHSFLIGLMASESSGWTVPNFAVGVQDICDREGYSMVFYMHRDAADGGYHCRNCVNRRVEGLIISGQEIQDNAEDFLGLQKRGVPVVEVYDNWVQGVPAVMTDLHAGGRQAAEHLLSLGHRDLMHFTHDQYQTRPDATKLWQGFHQVVSEAGLTPGIWTSRLTKELPLAGPFVEQAKLSARALLSQVKRPTAVFCYSEHHALALLETCRDMGIRVPHDLSVVGFNDFYSSYFSNPPLTTIRHAWRTLGQRAAEVIFNSLHGKPVHQAGFQLVEPEFIVRGSTAAPQAAQ